MPEHTSRPSYLYAWGQGDTGATLAFCSSLLSLYPDLERLVDGADSWKQRGINSLNADCFLASWYLSTTVLTASLNRPEGTDHLFHPWHHTIPLFVHTDHSRVCQGGLHMHLRVWIDYGFFQDLDSLGRTVDNGRKVALSQMSNSVN